jgi:hypothetical protein
MWHKQIIQSYDDLVAREVGLLEQLSEQLLNDYFESANRFGEVKQVGYATAYLKCRETIQRLLLLGDPITHATASNATRESDERRAAVVEIVVHNREELERFRAGQGHMDYLEYERRTSEAQQLDSDG